MVLPGSNAVQSSAAGGNTHTPTFSESKFTSRHRGEKLAAGVCGPSAESVALETNDRPPGSLRGGLDCAGVVNNPLHWGARLMTQF